MLHTRVGHGSWCAYEDVNLISVSHGSGCTYEDVALIVVGRCVWMYLFGCGLLHTSGNRGSGCAFEDVTLTSVSHGSGCVFEDVAFGDVAASSRPQIEVHLVLINGACLWSF